MGEVRRLWIPGPAGRIEAALRVAHAARAVAVVAHPHPLHGGTLHHPVVFHVDRQLHGLGLTTLRFNFRGVGGSDGEHDEGRGEIEDVGSAASWIRGLAPEQPLLLVGYSFGSLCSIRFALQEPAVRGLIAIGLPLREFPIREEIMRFARPIAVVQGSADEFGAPDEVREILSAARPAGRLSVVEGAPHLFPKMAAAAAAAVEHETERMLAALGTGF